MNCGLQFGQVVAWCSHKSTWQQSSSASDRACHQVASDVNTRGAREKKRGRRGGQTRRCNWSVEWSMRIKEKTTFEAYYVWSQEMDAASRGSPLLPMFSFSSPSHSLSLSLSVAFLAAIKRQNKNYAVNPLWLPDNNPLLLLCASFILKTSKFSFSKIFNFIFEAWQ